MRKLMTTAVVALVLAAAACGDDEDDQPVITQPDAEASAPVATPDAGDVVAEATAEAASLVRPMPCAAEEVYVWVDYEAGTAECVAGDDHARHAGH